MSPGGGGGNRGIVRTQSEGNGQRTEAVDAWKRKEYGKKDSDRGNAKKEKTKTVESGGVVSPYGLLGWIAGAKGSRGKREKGAKSFRTALKKRVREG